MVWPDGFGAAVDTAAHPTHRRILGLAPAGAAARLAALVGACAPGAGGGFGSGAGAVQTAQAMRTTIEFLTNQAAPFAAVEALITISRS